MAHQQQESQDKKSDVRIRTLSEKGEGQYQERKDTLFKNVESSLKSCYNVLVILTRNISLNRYINSSVLKQTHMRLTTGTRMHVMHILII